MTGTTVTYDYGALATGKLVAATTNGARVAYSYDGLGRLLFAGALAWGQELIYDGYGNLYRKQGTGVAHPGGSAEWSGSLNSEKNQVGPHSVVGNAAYGSFDHENRRVSNGSNGMCTTRRTSGCCGSGVHRRRRKAAR